MTTPQMSPRDQLLDQANPFLNSGPAGPGVQLPRVPVPAPAPELDFPDLDARDADGEELVPLFKLDGHVYTIPANPPAGFALKYLSALKHGVQPDAAAGQLLEDMLGEAAFAAMATSPKVKITDFATVMEIVKTRVLGPALDALGK